MNVFRDLVSIRKSSINMNYKGSMGILGILTCEILELEFAELLAADKDLGRITVLEDECSANLIAALESIKKRRLKPDHQPQGVYPC